MCFPKREPHASQLAPDSKVRPTGRGTGAQKQGKEGSATPHAKVSVAAGTRRVPCPPRWREMAASVFEEAAGPGAKQSD